jgi:hypothetical protein
MRRRLFVTPYLREQNRRDLAEFNENMEAIRRDRLRTSPRPIAPRRPLTSARRPVGYPDGRPHLVCSICFEPAHLVPGTVRCEGCHAEVRWRVGLAQRGLRVVD